ncbi:uroporphyrinogen decarboxylase family protein [Desulfosporosinus meridiei]|uniref:Uroporphyrinogen-III decarboxylase n=1 Tax=Desulfosporosinus meridiei (strain ATCC BAA-275 / DSM 13257 / KCTC 12902 / NCIMB 13706 / S10) TaxID=768704 RepID=J7ITX8_DESMD|nr:uroporphyrinogen decarboxylase family protein [Desulfosporosinus meridiei]AFQ45175.1 uroporphyrinogen-III decarboxylase [Desulfosporosinus meridiei DSM 13257]
MIQFTNYKCPEGSDTSGFTERVVEKVGLPFPEAYTYGEGMARIACTLREAEGGTLCMVPFCHTVEAENLGGNIKLGTAAIGPRCREPVCQDEEDLLGLPALDFEKGRLKETLEAVKLLKAAKEAVGIEICGPMTILNNLSDISRVFKIWRKNPEVIEKVVEKIRLQLLRYIEKSLEVGVDFIAFEDPVGGLNILGPKYFELQGRHFSRPFVEEALKIIGGQVVMHLCPKTALQLTALGMAEWESYPLPEPMSYAQACLELRGQVNFVGNVCIHNRNSMLKDAQIKTLKLRTS